MDLMWLARYDELKAHPEENSGEYPVQGDAAGLGVWIDNQRQAYKRPENDPSRLSEDHIALLEQLPGRTWEGRLLSWGRHPLSY